MERVIVIDLPYTMIVQSPKEIKTQQKIAIQIKNYDETNTHKEAVFYAFGGWMISLEKRKV